MLAAIDPVEIARDLGSRPLLCFLLMVITASFALLALVLAVRWSDSHARTIWGKAKTAWGKIAKKPAMRALEAKVPWIWRAMRRLTATEYLLLHLAIGLAVAFAGLAFVKLGQSVNDGRTVVEVDLTLANALHSAASPRGVQLMTLFSSLGGSFGIPLIGISAGAVLIWKRKRLLLIGWVIALAGAGLLNGALKAAFERPRPLFVDPFDHGAGWSFPSGHSMVTLVAAGMLAYLGVLFARTPLQRLLFVLLALAWTVSMGFSRIYLGLHYLSDVVAGFAAGTVWLGACVTGIEIARRRPRVRPAPIAQ